jgi:DHA3 family tetracycline resistance protein-like MFS transporter
MEDSMEQVKMYYLIRTIMGISFNLMFTAAALYRIDIAQLEIYELILIGSALEIAVFVFEVPTGIIADLKSRRMSVIIGLFIIGIGFSIEALTPYFGIIFISQVIWGFGYTFISGALDSWISDETMNHRIEHTIITGTQFNKVFAFLGILLAGFIGMVSLRGAIYLASGLFIVMGFIAIVYMKEDHFTKNPHHEGFFKGYYIQLVDGLKHIKTHKILRYMFIVMLLFGLYSEGIDRTFEINILDNLGFRTLINIPAIWILAIVASMIELMGFGVLFVVKRYAKSGRHVALWASNLTGLMVIGILVFAFVNNPYLAVFGFLFFSFSREGTYPLLNAILIRHIPSKIKATVLSSFGQLDAIGQLFSGAVMVGVSLWVGLANMYMVSALLLVIPFIALFKISRLSEKT